MRPAAFPARRWNPPPAVLCLGLGFLAWGLDLVSPDLGLDGHALRLHAGWFAVLLAAWRFGPRWGLLAGLGAQAGQLAALAGGEGSWLPPLTFLLWVLWHGLCAELRLRRRRAWQHPYLCEFPFRLAALGLAAALGWPGRPLAAAGPAALVVEEVVNAYLSLILADTLLRMAWPRRLLGLAVGGERREEERAMGGALAVGLGFWVLDGVLDHCYFFPERGGLGDALLSPPGHDVYMRGMVLIGALLMGLLATRLLAAQRKSELRFSRLVENLRDGLFVQDPAGRITYANQRLAAILGLAPPAMLGRSPRDFQVEPAGDPNGDAPHPAAAALAGLGRLERWRRADGRELILLASPRVLLDEGERFLGGFTVLSDVTAEAQAQGELAWQLMVNRCLAELAQAMLIPGRDLHSLAGQVLAAACALTHSRHGFLALLGGEGKEGETLSFSTPETGGCRLAKAPGRHPLPAPGEDGRYPGLFGVALNSGRPFLSNAPRRHPAFGEPPPGHPPLERFLAAPVILAGRPAGLLALADPPGDYREDEAVAVGQLCELFALALDRRRRQMEGERLEGLLRQAQKMEALGTMAGGVAHDFNNLVQGIMGYVELGQGPEPGGPDPRACLVEIGRACERAADLTRGLLAFARRRPPAKQVLDLNQLIRRLEGMLARLLPKMVAIETVLSPTLAQVEADPGQIEQVILNLALNAGDAMPEGGSLSLATQNLILDEEYARLHPEALPGRYVRLAVSDSGRGMDAATAARVFEPFFTTKPAGQGTGLGLAVAHGIARAHGGHLTCYSEPGSGTTMNLYLPARELSPAAGETAGETGSPPQGRGELILLVDDEEPLRQVGRELLQAHGYQVATARDGEEALALAGARIKELALVILDLGMPGMGGEKCLAELKARAPALPVLIASGYGANGRSERLVARGARGFLAKPYTSAALLRAVAEALRRPL